MSFDTRTEYKAAIDIGTNTAHLIVAKIDKAKHDITVIKKKRHYIFLAENGITRISEEAHQRLMNALRDFFAITKEFDISEVVICATEALRKAQNGDEIRHEVKDEFGWDIEVITGQREAELIYSGVRSAIDMNTGEYLIMDIGGGSVEFIGVANGKAFFFDSYPIGIANLYRHFHHEEPFTPEALNRLNRFVEKQLVELFEKIRPRDGIQLIGSAGTFEVLVKGKSTGSDNRSFSLQLSEFQTFSQSIKAMNYDERLADPRIPEHRAKYIVVALALIECILKKVQHPELLVSKHALKEGILLS